MKKIWQKIKDFVVKNYLWIINWIVLIAVYAINQNVWIEVIVGLWIFAQVGIFGWRWFKKSSSK